MATVVKGSIRDGVQGAWIEFGTFTLDAASIAATAQGAEAVTITGAKTGDLIFVNEEAGVAMLACVGAKVTNADTVTVYLNNMYDATTAVDQTSKTFNYMLVHLS